MVVLLHRILECLLGHRLGWYHRLEALMVREKVVIGGSKLPGMLTTGSGELWMKALHRPWWILTMTTFLNVAPLFGGIIDEPLHLPRRLCFIR